MRIKSFVQKLELELDNELIQHYIKSYNNKCLNKVKILDVIWKYYSIRNDIYE